MPYQIGSLTSTTRPRTSQPRISTIGTGYRSPRTSNPEPFTFKSSVDRSPEGRKARIKERKARTEQRKQTREQDRAAGRDQFLEDRGLSDWKPGDTSITSQIRGVIKSAPYGVLDFAKAVGNVPYSAARAGVDLARNIPGANDLIGGQSNLDMSGNWMQDIQAGFREYVPLAADMATSVNQSYQRNISPLTNPLLEGRPQDLVNAPRELYRNWREQSDQGTIIQAFTEDAGNAALVAGGISGALGKVGTTRGALAGGDARLLGQGARSTRPFGGPFLDEAAAAPGIRPGNQYSPPRRINTNPTQFPLAGETVDFMPRAATLPGQVPGPNVVETVNPVSSIVGSRTGGTGLAGYLDRRVTAGVPNVAAPQSALNVQRAGQAIGKFGLGADWLDPSTPIMDVGMRVIGSGGRRYGPGITNWLQQTREAALARNQLETASTIAQKAAIDSQQFVDKHLKSLGDEFKDVETRDIYGGVILDVRDQRIGEIAAKWDQIPDTDKANVLAEYNSRRPDGSTPITPQMIDLFNDYQSGALDPRATAILDEGYRLLDEQLTEHTNTSLALNNLEPDQLKNATRRFTIDPDTGAHIPDDTPLLKLSQTEIEQARKDGAINIPYLPRVLEAQRESLAGRRETEVAKREPLVEERNRLQSELGFAEASRLETPPPGTDVPYADTLAGRQNLSIAEQMRLTVLQEQLDAAIESEAVMGVDQLPDIQAEIRSISEEMGRITDPEAMAELEARSAQLVQDELAAANSPTLDEYTASISQALADQKNAADAATEGIALGVNTTPAGMWEGSQGPNGTLPRDQIESGIVPPIEGTMLADSPAVEAAIQEGRLMEQLDRVNKDIWVTDARIESYDRKSQNLERDLGATQQTQIKRINGQGVTGLQQAVMDITDTPIGEWQPNPAGPGGRISGLLGELATRYQIYGRVVNKIKAIETAMRKEWDSLRPEDLKYLKQEKNIHTFEQYRDFLGEQRGVGKINSAVMAFDDVIKAMERRTGKGLSDADVARYRESLVADELARSLEPFKNERNLLAGFSSFEQLQSTIAHLPEELRAIAEGNDVTLRIDDAHQVFIDKWERQLDQLMDTSMTATPARYRTPLLEARKFVSSILREARRQYELVDPDTGKRSREGMDTASALELLTRDSPTSFEAYATGGKWVDDEFGGGWDKTTSGIEPQYLTGGQVLSFSDTARSTRKKPRLKAEKARGEFKRGTGERVATLREYANLEAAQMQKVITAQGIIQIANNKAWSKSLMQVIGDQVQGWRDQGGRGTLTFQEMRRMAEEAGYSVVEGVGGTEWGNPSGLDTTPLPQVRRDARGGIDESGVTRTTAIDGRGRNVDIAELGLAENMTIEDYGDVRVIPTKINDEIQSYKNPDTNKAVVMLDQLTQLWKTATLAWSAAWITYNAVGNALMATFSAGMNPIDIVIKMDRIREAMRSQDLARGGTGKRPLRTAFKNEGMSGLLPARLETHGLSWSERSAILALGDQETRLGRALDKVSNSDTSRIGRLTEFSYALNEFTDNMFRSAVYLNELEKNAPVIPREYLTETGQIRTDLDATQIADLETINVTARDAQDRSVRAALNTMGDFTRLTPIERRYIKRAVPFYPWLRHQTAMTFRMPLNNPLRWAFMASLDNIIGDDDDPSAMEELGIGTITFPDWVPGLGGRSADIAPASPFLMGGITSFGGSEASIFSPQGVIGVMNPVAKAGLGLTLGYDQQGNILSRPLGEKPVSDFGAILAESPLAKIANSAASNNWSGVGWGLTETGYSLTGALSPQARAMRDTVLLSPLLGGDQRPRYDDGSVVQNAENRDLPLISQILRIARAPGVPTDITRRTEIAQEKDDETGGSAVARSPETQARIDARKAAREQRKAARGG